MAVGAAGGGRRPMTDKQPLLVRRDHLLVHVSSAGQSRGGTRGSADLPAKVIPRESSGNPDHLRERSARIVAALRGSGVTHVVGVPDNATRMIFEMFDAIPDVQVVYVCREGEAWAVASGLWVGGKVPVVVIQNTGLLESGDALRGTAVEMGIPLLALMDYRGHHTLNARDGSLVDSAAAWFEPTLAAWRLPYQFLRDGLEGQDIREAADLARSTGRPAAVLLT